jgi:two-component system, sensor histidine kinase and response regulator
MILNQVTAEPAEGSGTQPLSVLVIDDDPTQRLLIGAALEGRVEVVEAENGLLAVDALEGRRFDIAICDLEMPVMDGFGVIERARARAETRHLPIIVVTGRDDVVAIERAFALGATSFLCKPINWNVFRHQVAYVLKVAQSERLLREAKLHAERLASLRRRGLSALEREIGRAVGTLARLVDDGAVAEASPAGVSAIAATAARLQSVLRRIERASEILNGAAELVPETLSAAELAKMAAERVRDLQGPRAADRIAIDAPGSLRVSCDPGAAAEALAEVLQNALRFSPSDGPVRMRVIDAPPNRVRFEIADPGPGIPDYVLEAAIDGVLPESTSRTAESGAGLGLLMAKAIVDRHGGHFGIMSEPGQGTEVFLSFPSAA